MPSKKTYPGINIQYPISQMILGGEKTIETRKYPIPLKYINKEMALIETPGKTGSLKARTIAIIKFTGCFKYKSKKEFYSDVKSHCVTKDSIWSWKDGDKWGWRFVIIRQIHPPVPCTPKGIVYRKDVTL